MVLKYRIHISIYHIELSSFTFSNIQDIQLQCAGLGWGFCELFAVWPPLGWFQSEGESKFPRVCVCFGGTEQSMFEEEMQMEYSFRMAKYFRSPAAYTPPSCNQHCPYLRLIVIGLNGKLPWNEISSETGKVLQNFDAVGLIFLLPVV